MQKRKRQAAGIRLHVERLFGMNAGQRTRGHVANGVVTGLARGQPDVGQQVQQIRHLPQRHEVELHVLARGKVSLAAGVVVSDFGKLAHLFGGQKASGNLGPDHLDAGLSLAVDPAAEAVRAKLIVSDLAGKH